MANYESMFRTNYVKPKHVDAFKMYLARYDDILVWDGDNGTVGFGSMTQGVPDILYIDALDEYIEVDFLMDVSGHLREGEVLIVKQIANESLRTVDGFAWAVNHKGQVLTLDLDGIYQEVLTTWAPAKPPTEVLY